MSSDIERLRGEMKGDEEKWTRLREENSDLSKENRRKTLENKTLEDDLIKAKLDLDQVRQLVPVVVCLIALTCEQSTPVISP